MHYLLRSPDGNVKLRPHRRRVGKKQIETIHNAARPCSVAPSLRSSHRKAYNASMKIRQHLDAMNTRRVNPESNHGGIYAAASTPKIHDLCTHYPIRGEYRFVSYHTNQVHIKKALRHGCQSQHILTLHSTVQQRYAKHNIRYTLLTSTAGNYQLTPRGLSARRSKRNFSYLQNVASGSLDKRSVPPYPIEEAGSRNTNIKQDRPTSPTYTSSTSKATWREASAQTHLHPKSHTKGQRHSVLSSRRIRK